jgi:hypothetical protein
MAVRIRMVDGEELVVTGALGEVQQHLISHWSGLAEFKLEGGDARVLLNTRQIMSVREYVPATVTI